jgi:hypothetical protein
MSAAMVVVTVAKMTRGAQRNQCADPKETDFRRCTWIKIRAEIMRKHVWWKVSASHSRAAESESTREEALPVPVSDDGRGWNHWLKASQANTATAEMSQSASQT